MRWTIIVLAAVALFAVGRVVGWIAHRARQVNQIRAVRAVVQDHGGHFYYDFQLADGDRLLDRDSPDAPMHWLVRATGIDPAWLHDVVYVTFAQFDHFVRDGGVPARREEITDALIEPVTRLRTLRWIALSGTAITDATIDRLTRRTTVERIWLSQTRISDRSLEWLSRLPGLTHLAIEGTPTTDRGLEYVAGLRGLRFLSLGSPHYTPIGLRRLGELAGLEELYADGLPIEDSVCLTIGRLSALKVLSLRGTPVTDRGVAAFSGLTNVRDLRLDGTRLTDRGVSEIAGLRGLKRLSLSGTSVTDRGLIALEPCRELESIELRGTRVTLGGLYRLFVDLQGRSWAESLAIATGARLDEAGRVLALDLSGLRVRDEDLPLLRGLEQLQWLKMPRCEASADALARLPELGLERLSLLDLSGCAIDAAAVEAIISRMPQLRDLHLENVPIAPSSFDRMRQKYRWLRIYASQ